jgi:hypothetical protein
MARQKYGRNITGFGRTGYNPFKGRPQTRRSQTWNKRDIAVGLPDVPNGTIIDITPAPGRTYTRQTWPPRGRGRGESLTSDRRIDAKIRAVKVVEMRLVYQQSWQHIANTLGYRTASGAYRAFWRIMDRVNWDRDRKITLQRQQYR